MASATLSTVAAADSAADNYDRMREVMEFEDSKTGVHGLVESGTAAIPHFFHQSPQPPSTNGLTIPRLEHVLAIAVANDQELAALKAIIKSIEEHKLEEQYPIDPLQRRILQLEKTKADKKRVAEAENHGFPLMAPAAPYNLSPNHGGFYRNGYQYAAPYIH